MQEINCEATNGLISNTNAHFDTDNRSNGQVLGGTDWLRGLNENIETLNRNIQQNVQQLNRRIHETVQENLAHVHRMTENLNEELGEI